MISQIAYYIILEKLRKNELLHGEEIEALTSNHIQKIFALGDNIKNKSRLYNFTINNNIKEEHVDIALKNICIKSFQVKGNYSVPFRLSYFNKIPNLKPQLINFISQVSNNYGKTYHKTIGLCYIDVIFDLSRKEIGRMLFPTLMKSPSDYEEIMENFGYRCRVCKNTGKFKGKKCFRCEGRSENG